MTKKTNDAVNNFSKKEKEFHKADPDNWKRPVAGHGGLGPITHSEPISTEEEYSEMYYRKGGHFDLHEEKVMPKIKKYIEWSNASEMKALNNCTDLDEFLKQSPSFRSEVSVFLFLHDLFGDTLSHPKSGYDFEFTYSNEKYRMECVSPKKGEGGPPDINFSRPQVRTGKKGDREHQYKSSRITSSIKSKVEQLEKMECYTKSFNFIFIDITDLFWRTGAMGLSDEDLEDLLYSKKNGRQLSKEETKIETKNVYTYDFSFCSDSMKNIHGIFIARSLSLSSDKKQGANLYINPNTPRGLSGEFLKKIQSSKVFQVCVHDDQE